MQLTDHINVRVSIPGAFFAEVRRLALFIFFTAMLLLLPGGPVSAQAHNCTSFQQGPNRWLQFPNSNYLSGTISTYSNDECSTVYESIAIHSWGWALANSEADAATTCGTALRGTSEVSRLAQHASDPAHYTFNYQIWICAEPTDVRPLPARKTSVKNGVQKKTKSRPKQTDLPPTGVTMMKETSLVVTAAAGLDSGIQFQRVNAAGVGNDAVLSLGLLDAVDVWGVIGSGYTVCFPQIGRVIFLDASTSPRTPMNIVYVVEDGVTCASMDQAGTLALVRESEPNTNLGTTSDTRTLENCQVTARFNLNFRDGPAGQRVDGVPRNFTLSASARTRFWFKVSYNDQDGWVSAAHVTAEGSCAFSTIG